MQNTACLSPERIGPLKAPRVRRGSAIAHHGEILQGVFEEPDGHLRRGLVSLICKLFKSEAVFYPDSSGVVSVDPVWRVKARQAAQLTLLYLGRGEVGGRLQIRSNVPTAWGLGSSTSDVTAAIRAVASALSVSLLAESIAVLAVKAELASDPLMFGNRAVLFGHKGGIVIEDFRGPLPQIEVLGFNTDPTQNGIDTLKFPPARYSWREIETFRPLVGLMRKAVYTQDPRLVGRVASASARINQRHLPTRRFQDLESLVEKVGALGLQVAHSGTVVGLLFDPADASIQQRIECARALIAEMGFGPIWGFRAGSNNEVLQCESAESVDRLPKPSNSLE